MVSWLVGGNNKQNQYLELQSLELFQLLLLLD